MIKYVQGDATDPITKDNVIIAHICNNKGGWGKGFVLAISKRWKQPEIKYRNWFKSQVNFRLGEIQVVSVSEKISIINMIAQDGYMSTDNPIPLNYCALYDCLNKLAEHAILNKSQVHMPKIGTNLAGGDWNKIEKIIIEQLCNKNIPVFVYEFNKINA